MTTVTAERLWLYKRDLETAASRLNAIIETMNADGLVSLNRARDLPDVTGWIEGIETEVKFAIKEIEQ